MKTRLQLYHSILDCLLFQVELAEICAKSERYIGTEGGGMDQSISFLAEEGTVSSIEPFGNFNLGKYLWQGRPAAPSTHGYGKPSLLGSIGEHCPTVS